MIPIYNSRESLQGTLLPHPADFSLLWIYGGNGVWQKRKDTSMKEKFVLITGASGGIGYPTALLFATKGYHVIAHCHKHPDRLLQLKEELSNSYGAPCHILSADLSCRQDVQSLFQKVYEICPALDVLVNNTGISYVGLFTDMASEDWETVLHTNLSSVFYCCQEALPPMIRQKRGKIINISSIWGSTGASCEVAYSAAKSGVNGLTRALAKELAPSNIQVNALAFGAIDTSMNHHLSEEERMQLQEDIPMGRFGTPEEAALAIYTLAEAPSYLTGQIIGVDGGFC